MKGILYGEVFVEILCICFIIYSVLYAIVSTLIDVDEKTETEKIRNDEKQKSRKNKIKNIVTFIIVMGVPIGGMLGGIYLVANAESVVPALLVVALSFLFCTIVFVTAICDFLKYVFGKHKNYELTKSREGSLWLMGLAACIACLGIELEEMEAWIENAIASWSGFQADIIKMAALNFWYFSISFFTVCSVLLFINKTIKIYRKCTKGHKHKEKTPRKEKHQKKELLSEKLWMLTENTTKMPRWKKVACYVGWAGMLVLELLAALCTSLVKMIAELLYIVVIGVPVWLLTQLKKILKVLERDIGKAIIISSRISLVGSLLIVYFVDKYQTIFSPEGSDVYEFMCSVILIPFLITELGALREKK